jgi:hypothetical protein
MTEARQQGRQKMDEEGLPADPDSPHGANRTAQDQSADEPIHREEYDHGTDEYVSDCNRLPFSDRNWKIGDWGCCCLALALVLGCVAAAAALICAAWAFAVK